MHSIIRTAVAAISLAVLSGPASAQGWGFSFGFGDPYGDPYYHPEYHAYPPPPVYYGPPPVVIVPEPSGSGRTVVMVSPEEVEDDLLANGFSRLGRVEVFEGVYQLTANDPGGNLVALTISMRTGQIEMVEVLEEAVSRKPPARRAAPVRPTPKVPVATKSKPPAAAKPAVPAAKPKTPKPPPAPAGGKPDPLVVY